MKKFVHHWLNFTSGERKGILVLAVICIVALSARWWFPVPHYSNQISADSLQHLAQMLQPKMPKTLAVDSISSPFSINSADSMTWVKAGLSPYQARTVTHYLAKGGKIKETKDLWKLYFMDSTLFNHLSKLVLFDEELVEKGDKSSFVKKNQVSKKILLIELNLADSASLVAIQGIGPVFASRIIRYRNLLGGFVSLSQLNEVYGLSNHLNDKLLSQFRIDTTLVTRININSASFIQLMRHPYIGKSLAQEISTMRRKSTINSNTFKNMVDAELYLKLDSYLAFQ